MFKNKSNNYGKRQDYPVVEIAQGVYKISEFNVTNCYLVLGSERALLIDVGTGFGDLRGFVETLTHLPISVVVTHIHPDHMGGMGQFEEIHAHKVDVKYGYKLWTGLIARKIMFKISKGVVDNTITRKDITKGQYRTNVISIDDNHIFDLGDRQLLVKHLTGHTRGSIILIDEQSKIMFTGDNVCPAPWVFLPNSSSLEEWVESAKIIHSLSQSYTPYWAHEKGILSSDLIGYTIELAEQIIKSQPKNKLLSRVKCYPCNDRVNGSIVYRTGNVYKRMK